MDKVDIFGIGSQSDDVNVTNSKEKKSVEGTDFISSLRGRTNKNLHLNLYTNKIDVKNVKVQNLYRLKNFTREEMAAMIAKRIVFANDDYVLLNKPNGISVEGSNSRCFSILDVIPQLSSVMNLKENLHVVHRLDKDTTGALLLAKNPQMAFLLKDAFKRRQIRKTYMCLTHGVPYPKEGIIDFPLKETGVDGHFMITPDFHYIDKREKKIDEVVSPVCTSYKVLYDNYNVALVQCSMLCGEKHQIRAHLAYGLDTAILGDHKYAWFTKSKNFPIMPQVLSPVTLGGLGVLASKTRHIPIHLHAHRIIVNGIEVDGDGCRLKSMNLHVPLPSFFIDTLKKLKLFDSRTFKNALKQIF